MATTSCRSSSIGAIASQWKTALVVRVRNSVAEAGNAGKDMVGVLGPRERLWVGIRGVDVSKDRLLQLADTGESATLEPAAAQKGKPALNQVEPRGRGRGEVQVKVWPLDQPVVDQSGLVGLQIVEHEMHLQA